VERFNKTLKAMLRKAIDKDGRNWDQLLPYLLFAIREVPQASTGFSSFDLLYSHKPRGLLDIAKETWEEQPCPHRTMIEHVGMMKDRMAAVFPIVKEHMEREQRATYNRAAQPREFSPGNRVLQSVRGAMSYCSACTNLTTREGTVAPCMSPSSAPHAVWCLWRPSWFWWAPQRTRDRIPAVAWV